eukprot:9683641-Alexandrium_andersonii.AAC.1
MVGATGGGGGGGGGGGCFATAAEGGAEPARLLPATAARALPSTTTGAGTSATPAALADSTGAGAFELAGAAEACNAGASTPTSRSPPSPAAPGSPPTTGASSAWPAFTPYLVSLRSSCLDGRNNQEKVANNDRAVLNCLNCCFRAAHPGLCHCSAGLAAASLGGWQLHFAGTLGCNSWNCWLLRPTKGHGRGGRGRRWRRWLCRGWRPCRRRWRKQPGPSGLAHRKPGPGRW